ncbi:hypothetical protein U1Q18_042331 [Sarracenia purpurea var. burkii]
MAMLLSLSQYVLVKRVTSSGVFREECYRSALADAEAVFGFNLYIDIYQNGCVYEYVSIATSRRNICSVERRECCFTNTFQRHCNVMEQTTVPRVENNINKSLFFYTGIRRLVGVKNRRKSVVTLCILEYLLDERFNLGLSLESYSRPNLKSSFAAAASVTLAFYLHSSFDDTMRKNFHSQIRRSTYGFLCCVEERVCAFGDREWVEKGRDTSFAFATTTELCTQFTLLFGARIRRRRRDEIRSNIEPQHARQVIRNGDGLGDTIGDRFEAFQDDEEPKVSKIGRMGFLRDTLQSSSFPGPRCARRQFACTNIQLSKVAFHRFEEFTDECSVCRERWVKSMRGFFQYHVLGGVKMMDEEMGTSREDNDMRWRLRSLSTVVKRCVASALKVRLVSSNQMIEEVRILKRIGNPDECLFLVIRRGEWLLA